MLTATEIFRRVVDGLIGQGLVRAGKETESGDFNCLYRAEQEDGTVHRCAAGQLIPDEDYKPEYEGGACNSTGCSAGLYFQTKYPGHGDMLGQLQDAHDWRLKHNKKEWAERMIELYRTYSINCPMTLLKLETIAAVC